MFLALLTSCFHARGGDAAKTRESVYKTEVTLTLDITPFKEYLAAQEKANPPPTDTDKKKTIETILQQDLRLTDVQRETGFEVLSTSDNTAQVGWSGTSWVAVNLHIRSYAMTAGHVCESGDSYELQFIDWNTWEVVSLKLPILKKEHTLVARDGAEIIAKVIRDEDMDDSYNGNDLCLLGAPGDLGPSISIGNFDPEFGETCTVVGAPRGLWGGGIAVASDVKFSGRGSVFEVEPDGLAFNGLVAQGNSGSAVVCRGQALGVISLGSRQFPSLIHAVDYGRTAEFLKKALHRK